MYKCVQCGNALQDGVEYCDKCGAPVNQKEQEKASVAEKAVGEQQNDLHSDKKKAILQHVGTLKEKSADFLGDVKNYKTLPKQKKRNVLIAAAALLAVVVIILVLLFSRLSGVSDKTVSQAALEIAQQDYGYQLELTSYDIVDSFTAKSTNAITGQDVKAKMYLVIIEAEAKDANGEVVERVKYGVSVVDPEKSGAYSPMSQAQNCTGMENEEIAELLDSATASFH